MFRIKRSFTAMMLAAAMMFGSTAAVAAKEDFVGDHQVELTEVELGGEELAENKKAVEEGRGGRATKLETFAANGDRVAVTIEAGEAIIVFEGKAGLGEGSGSGGNVMYGWFGDVVKVVIALLEVLSGDKDTGGSGSGSGSGGSGGNGSGGSSSGCTNNVTNTGGGTVIIHQTCGPA